jgi:hypothetical protein
MVSVTIYNDKKTIFGQPPGGNLNPVNEGAGGINYVNMPSPKLLLYLRACPMRANRHGIAPYIIYTRHYPNANLS